ncbi:tRNA (adenosine(37)-N6)-dimethylallyltransferase MiaA [Accumulibacter sp.]|uniref:tRNA (adenosine(37)-N6)-dimethylallyltransferase MiaA n=1 Tax=Accumulibacter sp. TaxID=2053492 RepID=UPI0025DE10CB|nr:tRNA (adenosine(37)-N6)-dimethylallyltransferase MiaA [Accumulibacter sp.]MCM8614155.1 tRNA (adenosine(37)-N6)-dimethylallyltransferase MiaA [Accumulibacter sp.]MCM8637922.1 tRNA (adenosine(37)-N6)-dimethylallyltransferase MiaA [Accumulibacter sp.]MCM8641391.1 tRNA (adenosine(37)-N6)-dimethylallyltransferase MiaA [Accumulibacter sp.]
MSSPATPATRLPPAILLLGPTASGKTMAAMAIARRFPVELISVDSAQVFRGMDIGTAKPDAATLAEFPHRLIDLISPEESYSAARFRVDALAAMAEATARDRVPLLVGGTMLYFKALCEGLADLPAADPATRASIEREAAARGWPALHAELAAVDPGTAARLHASDAQRIQRALEVFRLSGQPLSGLLAATGQAPPPYRMLSIGLVPSERSVLHRRIADRFTAMLAAGLEGEVESLRARYRLHGGLSSMRCVGYRQVWEVQNGIAARNELRDRGIYATRQLAKRQLTWIANSLRPQIVDCLAPQVSATLERLLGRFLD